MNRIIAVALAASAAGYATGFAIRRIRGWLSDRRLRRENEETKRFLATIRREGRARAMMAGTCGLPRAAGNERTNP